MQFIPGDPYESALLATTHRDMDTIFDDYLNHLVPDEARSAMASSD